MTDNKRKGIGSHQSAKMGKDEWLTPPEIIQSLGDFSLDPCAPVLRPWDTAKTHYTIDDDGLTKDWFGRVWCNPPYGLEAVKWLERMALHDNGIALIFARTETNMFFDQVWEKATALLFLKGRLYFHHVDGTRAKANAGAPSVLIAYGVNNAQILRDSGIKGKFLWQDEFKPTEFSKEEQSNQSDEDLRELKAWFGSWDDVRARIDELEEGDHEQAFEAKYSH
jgi:hypothetical protein